MSHKLTACFTGCSFTVGEGFPQDQRSAHIYDRIVSKHAGLDSVNLARGGWGNYRIFMQAANSITSQKYDIVFAQWSDMNRIWLSPGPEEWFASNDDSDQSFRYHDIYISAKDKLNFIDTVKVLNHDYQNIIDLVDYTKILNQLADANNVKIVHINGLVPWQDDLLASLDRTNLETFFSDYTKTLLNFETKPEHEVCYYFNKLQNKFNELDQTRWVNLFDSFLSNTVDTGPLGHHPGERSHRIMADKIINYLDKEMK
jgi:hypothetical protein